MKKVHDSASKKSRKYYEHANQLEPNNIIIINALGYVNADLKDFKEYFEYFEKALSLDSLDAITYLNYGFSRARNYEFKKAIEFYYNGVSLERNREKRGYLYYNMSRRIINYMKTIKEKFYIDKSVDLINDEVLKKEIMILRKIVYKK